MIMYAVYQLNLVVNQIWQIGNSPNLNSVNIIFVPKVQALIAVVEVSTTQV